jgi:hypothetical protein
LWEPSAGTRTLGSTGETSTSDQAGSGEVYDAKASGRRGPAKATVSRLVSTHHEVSQEWLVRFVKHRVGDPRIIRLIRKWLKAGVLEDGIVTVSDKGTGQGSVISPLLANVYLHYVFDLWAERWRRHEATGDMIIVRFADDIVVGFEHEADARRFWDAMRKRLEEFTLSLHPDKTRLIEFGVMRRTDARGAGLESRKPSRSWASSLSAGARARVSSSLSGNPGAIACRQSSVRSRRSYDGGCISSSPNRGAGWRRSFGVTSPITPCRPTLRHSALSATMSRVSGCARCGAAVRRTTSHGSGSRSWPRTFSRNPKPFIHGRAFASRHTPEVGAGCLNWARPDLCGVAPCKCVQLSRLRWRSWQSLASSRVPSLAWRPVTVVAKRRQGGCRPEH